MTNEGSTSLRYLSFFVFGCVFGVRPKFQRNAKSLPISTQTGLYNLMFQYRPAYLAYRYLEIARSLTESECEQASGLLAESGFYSD